MTYPFSGQQVSSNFSLHQLRLGLNYRFDDLSRPAAFAPSRFVPAAEIFAVHGQSTLVEQAFCFGGTKRQYFSEPLLAREQERSRSEG